ncbi:MAG TPA: ammonia-forming cytochrome c nitrite reductase subunit c552 [Oscillospiraceae bacterium]|nr:ammonia-forming cytochrome c nitrite reductase subunit c552 [Oscillospiraceae bacterium]
MKAKKWLTLGLLILLSMLIAAGCGGDTKEQDSTSQDGSKKQAGDNVDIKALTAQWVESKHSNILLSPAQRDECVVCHDGGAFAENITEVAAIERDFFISVDCRACHTGQGADLMEEGKVTIPTAEKVQGGSGAVCMFCHNSRTAPNIEDENRSAPHYSSQADLATGTGGMRLEGFDYGNTSAHVNIDDSCVGCHLLETEGGYASHSFKVDKVEAACGQCHQDINDLNLTAAGDYDGDGQEEGFQTEVEGLLALLQAAVGEELAGGSFESGHGAVVFKDAEGAALDEVPKEMYQAGYNYLLISSDGSLGIHNPTLTVQLLQQSYKGLTGEDVPKAKLK